MKLKSSNLVVFVLLLVMMIGYQNELIGTDRELSYYASPTSNKAELSERLQAVFFAQTHIKQTSEDYFFLTSDKNVFVKAYVISTDGSVPNVSLRVSSPLFHNTEINTISMSAPANIPIAEVNLAYGQIDHSLDNAFTAQIPKEWVKTDTEISVLINGLIVRTFDRSELNVMSSNPLKFYLFDVHAFSLGNRSQDPSSLVEMGQKIPVSEFDVIHVEDIVFPEISIAPNESTPARRVSSIEEYNTACNCSFNAHNSNSLLWRNALRIAAGAWHGYTCYISLGWYFDGSNAIKGQGGSSALGFGDVHTIGAKLFIHEVGHGLDLPHWGGSYPYQGDMHGISQPDASSYHVGPVWGYYPSTNYAIPPTVQTNAVGSINSPGKYKQDPMRGGGSGDQEEGFHYRHFSDFSLYNMATELQNKPIVVWNQGAQNYRQWDSNTGTYSGGNHDNESGIEFPIERDIDVYSLMFSVSTATPQANLIYTPIGPYQSGVIQTFDPTTDVGSADAAFFCNFRQGVHNYSGCHYTAKVMQGGVEKYYMLRADTRGDEFDTFAMNVKASDGEVTSIELLETPNVHTNGLPQNPTILASWNGSTLETEEVRSKHQFRLFPIPSKETIYIESLSNSMDSYEVMVYNSLGKKVVHKVNLIDNTRIDASTIEEGVYFIKIKTKDGSETHKIMVD